MSDFEIGSDYLGQSGSSTSTSQDNEEKADKTELVENNISKSANKAIDKQYRTDSDNTMTDDIKTYGLSKPKRIIITGILKND
jgi:hypothetical protein